MLQQQAFVITNFAMLLDGVVVIVAGYLAHYLTYLLSGGSWSMPLEVFVGSVMLVMFVNNYTLGAIGLYADQRRSSRLGLAWDLFRATMVDFSVLSVVIFVFQQYHYSRDFFIFFAIATFTLLLAGRLLFNLCIANLARRPRHRRKILVVGCGDRGSFVADLMDRQLSWGHEIIGRLAVDDEADNGHGVPTIGHIDDLGTVLKERTVDEVIFAIGADKSVSLNEHIAICKRIGIPARILPSLWSRDDHPPLQVERCQGVPFLVIRTDTFHATGLLYKRILDIIGGAVGVGFFFLLYPVIGLAIKLDSPGPVLFAQTRMGKNGRVFRILKFRTMYRDADKMKQELAAANEMNGAIFKIKDDPRITRVGRWLRKTSLDEVPQFWNVLVGEMSLVGTRPPTLEEVENYKDWHLRRLSIKPGITGLWQISGRNQIRDFDEIVRLDCRYLENWRLMEDIRIILKTVIVVLKRKGAR